MSFPAQLKKDLSEFYQNSFHSILIFNPIHFQIKVNSNPVFPYLNLLMFIIIPDPTLEQCSLSACTINRVSSTNDETLETTVQNLLGLLFKFMAPAALISFLSLSSSNVSIEEYIQD